MNQSAEAERHKADYLDRKALLPRRILKLCLRLASLEPGRYVLVVEVRQQGEPDFEVAPLRR